MTVRRLHLVLGDQLDCSSSIFDGFDSSRDRLWMAEVEGENTHVPHHKHQIVMFLAAMRHFAAYQEEKGRPVLYHRLEKDRRRDIGKTLGEVLQLDLKRHRPQEVRVVLPGDRRVLNELHSACKRAQIPLKQLTDTHFFCNPREFHQYTKGRKNLLMEHFYRTMRTRHGYLMTAEGKPLGGKWNFDADNRSSFGRDGPAPVKAPHRFQLCPVVEEVADMVETRYADHIGDTSTFALPVRREQALVLLREFIDERLPHFGQYQDAMWSDEHFLFHSRLSTSLNLKLLSPAEVCDKAEHAYRQGRAPLPAVEGFIRQILGWREYVRGIYWTAGESYAESNALEQEKNLPAFFWSGETDMECLSQTLRAVRESSYSHHIQRLMVTGLFCLLYGVKPSEYNSWHVATHCDAIDWVSVPNVIGMSQYADGGWLASKPYCASGAYIDRMSNYCEGCRYNPKLAIGEDACPFTTLYWNFLDRHRKRLEKNPRMTMQLKNLDRKSRKDREEIAAAAQNFRRRLC